MQTQVVQQGLDLGAIMNLVTAQAQRITNASGASVELIEKIAAAMVQRDQKRRKRAVS